MGDQFLTPEVILTAQDRPFEDVFVPEWGGTVRVLGLSAADAASFSSRMIKMDSKGNIAGMQMDDFMSELLVRTLANENNVLLFSEKDVAALGQKSAAVSKRLFEIAMRLSGLSDEAKESAVKNSDGTPAGALPSA